MVIYCYFIFIIYYLLRFDKVKCEMFVMLFSPDSLSMVPLLTHVIISALPSWIVISTPFSSWISVTLTIQFTLSVSFDGKVVIVITTPGVTTERRSPVNLIRVTPPRPFARAVSFVLLRS